MKKIKLFFKKILNKIKRLDYRHYISSGLILLLIGLVALIRPEIYSRLWFSIITFIKSLINIFIPLKNAKPIEPPKLGDYKFTVATDFKSLIYDYKNLSLLLFNKDNFAFFGIDFLSFLYNLFRVIIWIPLAVLLFLLINSFVLKEKDEDVDEETKTLIWFKKYEEKVIIPFKKYINSFITFLNKNNFYIIIFLIILGVTYRIVPIGIDIFSSYFNFIKFFDFTTVFNLIAIITFDIFTIISYYNKFFLFIFILAVFLVLRRYYGRKKLSKMQASNETATEQLAVATLITGAVGSGKTMMATSMGIDIEMQFRFKAFDIVKKYAHMFPEFRFDIFENWIISNFKDKTIVNRSQLKISIKQLFQLYKNEKNKNILFDYDTEKYPLVYFNGIRFITLEESLIEYGQAFYLYWVDKPLSFSNYSIRHQYDRNGYFPVYDYDYINMNKRNNAIKNHYSGIASFDSRRILTHFNQFDSTKWYQMDGQVEVYTEIDKERGNKDDHVGLEKKSDSANQKNDGFNKSIKITRHEFTIDGEPFTKLLFDSQREYSVNADLRETCEDRIKIQKKGDVKLALPFAWLDYLLCNPLIDSFDSYYYKFRNKRKDKTLYNYLIMKIIKPLYNHLTRIINTYGYQTVNYRHEVGATATERGDITDKIYYFIHQKMFADRYSTDCYSAFFDNERSKAITGFMQAPSYNGTKATIEELSEQDSYWIEELRTYTSLNEEQIKIVYKDD